MMATGIQEAAPNIIVDYPAEPSVIAEPGSGVVADDHLKNVKSTPESVRQEYDAQFFGFTPKSFSDGMYNAVLEYTWECFQSTTSFMRHTYPSRVSEEDVSRASAAILPQLTAAIDKAFDKFESYLRSNIFRMPDTVLLPEDAVHSRIPSTTEYEQQVDASIQQLEADIAAARYTNAAMRAELQQCARVQAMYDKYTAFMDDLDRHMHTTAGPGDALREALVLCEERATRVKALMAKLTTETTLHL